ncbi:hypothetical protein [Rhodoluna lacicola]|jgi:hypothetical protein|uniref:Uncharacterized protein n=1 Tax=Rhodoluna lacicola TaxID=529884 RepID=A0A060JEH8_9MICO|nr:hypothetical protein [Rhodoluna lacicola]AIC46997.1 hypothetical protein Rhola_00001700 [Rhodoluna lacicola]
MDLQILWDALLSIIPPALVGVLFYVIMRGIFRADATERKVYSEIEAEMRAARDAEVVAKAPKSGPKSAQKVTKTTKK